MRNAEEQKLQRRNSRQWIEQITSSLIAWVFRIPSATCVFQELAEESQPDKNILFPFLCALPETSDADMFGMACGFQTPSTHFLLISSALYRHNSFPFEVGR
jgi:hypothetical protein